MSAPTQAPAPAPSDTDSPYVPATTRPATASRHARGPKAPRKVTRYTLDLEYQQRQYLRLLAIQEGLESSRILRSALYLIESDPVIRDRVLAECWADAPQAGYQDDPSDEG